MKKKLLTILLSVFMIMASFTARVFADGEVAQIGETKYGTLQAAIDAAENGGVVDLLVSVEENVEITGKAVYIKPQDKVKINGSIVAECFVEHKEEGKVLYGDIIDVINYVSTDKQSFVTTTSAGSTIFFHVLKDLKLETDITLPCYGNTNSALYFNRFDVLEEPITLDLNGHIISQEQGNPGGYYWGSVRVEHANLIIKDSSDAKTGKIQGIGSCVVVYGLTDYPAKITLESGTLSMLGDTPNNGNGIVQTQYAGSFEMTGGTIDGSTVIDDNKSRGNFELMNPDDTYGRPDISISGGKIKRVSENNRDSHKTTGYVSPDGFMFNRLNTNVSSCITGGYYNFDPSAYVAQGYEVRELETSEQEYADGYRYEIVEKKVAKIGNVTYSSLAKAIAAVPTNGTKTTITMIDNETFADNANMTISVDQNIVLDLNGKTVTGKNLNVSTWAFLTNNGALTITDNSDNANGIITSSTTPATDGFAGHYTVLNKNKLTLEKGTIKETSEKIGGGVNLKWALRNEASANQTVSLTINGGQVIGEYNAVSNYVYNNSSICNFTVNGGTIKTTGRFSPVTMQIAGGTKPNCNININGGEFIVENIRNTNANGNAIIYCDDQTSSVVDTSNIKIKIAGGKYNTHNTAMIIQFDDFKTETTKPIKYMSAGIMKIAISDTEIDPRYTCVDNTDEATKEAYPYMIGKRTSGGIEVKEENVDDKTYYKDATDLQSAINNVTEKNQEKFDNNQTVTETVITVTNGDNRIEAEIDDKIEIIAKPVRDGLGNDINDVTAAPGYKLNDPIDAGNGNQSYTATALDIGKDYQGGADGLGKLAAKKMPNIADKAVADASDEVKLSASTVVDTNKNAQLVEIVCSSKNEANTVINNDFLDVLASRGIHQGTATKALNDSGIVTVTNEGSTGTTKASDISVFVRTYYETEVKEDKTTETNKSYKLDITPMYQAYASTATSIGDMVAEGDAAAATPTNINAVKIGNSAPVDCTGKTINLKIELAEGFITNVNQKVYVIHTLADDITKKTYDTTVTKEGGKFYIEFTNPDGFSVFEITLVNPNPTPGPTPSSDPKPRYKIPKTGVEGTTTNNH